MIRVHVQLYSILREKLPPDANGLAVLQMDDGASLQDLLDEFDIKRRVVISVNGEHETDLLRQLRNGDQVKLFSSISGGTFTAERDKGVNHGLRL
jgi:sulfur carrier protein ThiS